MIKIDILAVTAAGISNFAVNNMFVEFDCSLEYLYTIRNKNASYEANITYVGLGGETKTEKVRMSVSQIFGAKNLSLKPVQGVIEGILLTDIPARDY